MFFTKTDTHACTTLVDILRKYEAASGQKINTLKSSISFSSKTPEHFGRRKKDLFDSIIDRMKQKSLNWSTKFLSTAGKATMIMSVLSPIPSFAMTCFELPASLCKKIQSVLTRFWWDSSNGARKICWVSWDKMTPDSLLAKVLLGKYCHKSSFLKTKATSAISHGWRGVLLDRDLLIKHLGKAVGNGEATSLWNDSRESKEWNVARINNLLPELASHILALRPSILGANDSYIWPLRKWEL